MLKHLDIKNFALIDELELDFAPGLNIITGETGAGKSIIVDALMLALGDRASFSMIREGSQKAVIEATFLLNETSPVYNLLNSNDLDLEGDELLLRRELMAKGTTRCFVNDSPVSLAIMKQIGDSLVDFHGQHEHQALLRKEHHIEILDKMADLNNLKIVYLEKYNVLKQQIAEFDGLIRKEQSLKEKSEANIFELNQLKKIAPLPGEFETLETEINILENSEQLFNLTDQLSLLLSESDAAASNSVVSAKKVLEQLQKIDPNFAEFYDECNSVSISINAISSFARNYNLNIEFDNARIESIRERISILHSLRKKYGSLENALERQSFLEKELSGVLDYDNKKKQLIESINLLKSEIKEIALEISTQRKLFAEQLESGVIHHLKELGIQNGTFLVKFSSVSLNQNLLNDLSVNIHSVPIRLNSDGIDIVEFIMSTNSGETPKPLIDVASGGEVSRIMLSIKSLLAGRDDIPVMIFDEIDTGISGRIAQKVGIAMKKLSIHHQLIAITHLAQIAALGDSNISVIKNEFADRTTVSADILEGDEKMKEIAKLISGEQITEASINSVIELSKVLE